MTQIRILTASDAPQESEWRGATATRAAGRAVEVLLDSDALAAEIDTLVDACADTLEKVARTSRSVQVAEVELSLTVTASGKVSLLGFGVDAGAEAGIKILLKPKIT